MTSTELFGAMSPTLAGEIFDYVHAEEREFYKAAIESIARMRKVRAVFLERQPRAERFRALQSSLARSNMAVVADNLLRAWLLKKQNALLIEFLTALGIPHDKGVVEDLPKTVEDAPLNNAVEQCLTRHSPEIVAVYLHAFNAMNEARWANLDALLKHDPRLKLGYHHAA